MEPLMLAPKKVSKNDLRASLGGSFLVHLLVFTVAVVSAWTMPHKPIKPPYCSVNLVSLKDIGTGSSEPKGNPKAVEEKPAIETHKSVSQAVTQRKSGPVLPVKRLRLDDDSRQREVPIKKIEPKEAPKIADTPQSMAAIEKNLDKLITKPKITPRTSRANEAAHEPSSKPAEHSQPAGGQSDKTAHASSQTASKGSPKGGENVGARGTTQGSTVGTPDGSSAVSALAQLYGRQVAERIQSQWGLARDQGLDGLKTVVEVQIRKSGEIVNIQVLKPSGNALFDESAVRAVRKAAPLPQVPEFIAQSSTKLILTFLPGRVS
jgi:TonB family protein